MSGPTWRCTACRMPAHYPNKYCTLCRDDAGTLFAEPEPNRTEHLARRSDPDTSTAAAETVDLNAREREVIDALRLLVVASSTHEIAECLRDHNLPRDKNCVSRRLTSLVRKGVVSDQGRKPGPYGRDVTAYRLVPAEMRKAS